VHSESYQPVDNTTALLGFGILNKIVEDILGPSEWLKTTFGNQYRSFLQQWMQTTFLTRYKPILGSGRQNELEIHNNKIPEGLANEIEEAVLLHFDKVVNFALRFFNTWSNKTGINLKVSSRHHWFVFANYYSGSLHLVADRHQYLFRTDLTGGRDHTEYSIIRNMHGRFSTHFVPGMTANKQ
jgi:hypothetical protein